MSKIYELHLGKMSSSNDPDDGIDDDWIKENPLANYAVFDELKTGSAKDIIKYLIKYDSSLKDYQLVKKKRLHCKEKLND